MKNPNKQINQLKLALLVALVIMLCALLLLPICTPQIANAITDTKSANEQNFFVEQMNKEYESNVTLNKIKQLKDLENNTYTLLECKPTGYIIICDDSNTMVEYSAFSISPYIDYYNNLYYFGPTYFSVLDGDNFIDLMNGGILFSLTADLDVVANVKAESKNMHDTMINQGQNTSSGISP